MSATLFLFIYLAILVQRPCYMFIMILRFLLRQTDGVAAFHNKFFPSIQYRGGACVVSSTGSDEWCTGDAAHPRLTCTLPCMHHHHHLKDTSQQHNTTHASPTPTQTRHTTATRRTTTQRKTHTYTTTLPWHPDAIRCCDQGDVACGK